MIKRYFIDHPRTVGETYLEHLQTAAWFASRMIIGGMACLIHALVPGMFTKTGSKAISDLYDRMVLNRHADRPASSGEEQSH